MQFSISNIAWDASQDNYMYEYLMKSFMSGIEIAPTRLFPEKPYENLNNKKDFFKHLMTKYNLPVSSIQSIWYGKNEKIVSNSKEQAILLDYTQKAIDFAKAIECKNLVFGCPKNRSYEDTKEIDTLLDFINKCGHQAHQNGVFFSLEANPKIYNTNFINTTMDAIKICKTLNNPGIKINYDLGTVIYNEENIDTCFEYIHYINHIHISEPYLEKIQPRLLHENFIRTLKQIDYTGFISIEMKCQNDIQNVTDTISYIGDIYERV